MNMKVYIKEHQLLIRIGVDSLKWNIRFYLKEHKPVIRTKRFTTFLLQVLGV